MGQLQNLELRSRMSGDRYWLLELGRDERSTLVATFSGWMLDGMDVMIYTFVMPSLISLWHITRGQAGMLATSALVVSAAGGWVAGLAADRFGRVRILQITIAWFALFTFLSGFTTSYSQLLVVRALQGLGFGGEWAVGSVLIGEKVQARFRGRAVGTTQAGWAIGWAMAAAFYALFFHLLPETWAWRAMFFVGILPAALAFWIRGNVHEPEVFSSAERKNASMVIQEMFSQSMLRTILLTSAVALGAQGGYYAFNTFLPLYLQSRGLGVAAASGYVAVVIAGAFTGYMTSAHLADALGRRTSMVLFACGSFVALAGYLALPLGTGAMLALGFPAGFFTSGVFGPMGSFFSELFPTRLRASGQGFAYNVGRALGAFFPAVVGIASAHMPLRLAIAGMSLSAYAFMVGAVLLLPETRGRELNRI
jgi:MFS family permease